MKMKIEGNKKTNVGTLVHHFTRIFYICVYVEPPKTFLFHNFRKKRQMLTMKMS